MAHVSWFEIVGKDGKKLQDFYGQLFNWKIDANNPMQYGMVDNEGKGIGGGVGPAQSGQPWAGFYVEVEDLEATLSKAESMGGKTVMPPMPIEGYGFSIALFADPEGNQIGLMTPPPAQA